VGIPLVITTIEPREKIPGEKKMSFGRRSGPWRTSRRLRGSALALGWLLQGLAVAGCGREGPPPSSVAVPAAAAQPGATASSATPAAAPLPRVVFLGDSLTAGLGLGEEVAYPAIAGELLAQRGVPVRVVNAGVSGDTSAGGLARVDWLLSLQPDILVLALGANDGLRGQPVPGIEANLREIVRRARAAGARVVLAGMKMPPNYGPDYTRDFEALYVRLAKELDLPFIPFLLAGVAADPGLNQADGIHPTAEGQRIVARLVADALQPLLAPAPRAAGAARER
jgi:acyl-CoA thioesterase-1